MGRRKSSYTVVGSADDDTAGSGSDDGMPASRQRLRNDRVYTLAALAALIVLALASGMLGVAVSQRSRASTLRNRGVMVGTLSRTMTALMEEAAFSITFTNPSLSYSSGISGQTDRELAMEMTRLQKATRDAFDDAVQERLRVCTSCASILSMFDYPQLLNAQMAVRMRADTPREVYEFYAGAQLRLMRVMAYYAGWGVEGGVASAAWTEQLLFAARSMTFACVSWLDAYLTQSFMERLSYQLMSWAEANYRLVVPFASIMESQEGVVPRGIPPSMVALQNPVEPVMAAVRKVMSSGTTGLQNLQSVGSATPEEMTAEILAIYRSALDGVDAESPWGKVSESRWQWILYISVAMIVLAVATIGLAMWKATALVWAAGTELVQMKAAHRLESSLIRMHALVDSMYQLDGSGIEAATMMSAANSANAMGAERELLQVAGPASQVLSYINPCILDRCVRPSVPAEYVPGSPDGEELDRDSVLNGHIRTGLSLRPMSIAMVDLRCFAVTTVTVETSRSLSKDLFVFLNEMVNMAGQCGGTIVGFSGTVLIIGWNALTSDDQEAEEERAGGGASRGRCRILAKGGGVDSNGGAMTPENEACRMMVRFRLANLHRRYPKVRIAVVSGVCEQGVVGTASLRSYVVAGNFVRLGRMLLDIARVHNIPFVTDTATFLKLDTQQFCKRAIEVVSLCEETGDGSCGPARGRRHSTNGPVRHKSNAGLTNVSNNVTTIAYEVTIAGTEAAEYEVLWNAAFDDFFSGRAVESLAKLVAWSQLFGERQTWRRAASMLCQTGGHGGATVARTRTATTSEWRNTPMNPPKKGYVAVGDTAEGSTSSSDNNDANGPRQRLRNERAYTFVALVALVMFALGCGMLGVSSSQRAQASSLRNRGLVTSALSQTMVALLNEGAASISFTNPAITHPNGTNGLTDAEDAADMAQLQAATRNTMGTAVTLAKRYCSSCASIHDMFDYPTLLNMQLTVMMRNTSPEEVFQFYLKAEMRLTKAIAYYAGWGVEAGVASATWSSQLLLAGRTMTFAAGAWQDAYKYQSFMARSSYQFMSWAETNYELATPIAAVMEAHEGVTTEGISESLAELQAMSQPLVEAVGIVMNSATVNLQNLQSTGNATPQEMTAEVIAAYSSLINEVDAHNPWQAVAVRNWFWILGLSVAILALSLAVIALAVREATLVVWAADTELAQMKAKHRLESSMTRMHALLDSMYQLDREGLEEAIGACEANSSNATNAEREIIPLVRPAGYVLSYINPCILSRCVRPPQPTEYIPSGPNGDVSRDSVLNDHIRTGLSLRPMSIAMVDLRCFALMAINAEGGRTVPQEIIIFLNEMFKIVDECRGNILGISGTVLVVAWNALANPRRAGMASGSSTGHGRYHIPAIDGAEGVGTGLSLENDACQLFMRFRLANLHRKYPQVHIAVVSGICEQGVVGTTSLRSYVVAGNYLKLGRMLLEMGRLHNVPFLTDTATLLKIDPQQFRKRAIELVSLRDENADGKAEGGETESEQRIRSTASPTSRGGRNEESVANLSATGKTIVYEVILAGTERDEYVMLWNAAFDDFFSQRAADCYDKLVAWVRFFGKRQTWLRAASLLSRVGGYGGATVATTRTLQGFDYELFI